MSAARARTARRNRLQRLQAWALRVFWWACARLSPARAERAGAALFGWIGPRLPRDAQVRRNLSIAFPTRSRREHVALRRAVWANFGAVLAGYPHLGRAVGGLCIAVDPAAHDLLSRRASAVYVTAHLANWELAGVALRSLGVPLSVVYAPQGNPRVDLMLQRYRESSGCRFVGKRDCLRVLRTELDAGRSVGLLPDQRSDGGASLPFFGRAAETAISPAWLALRLGRPLVPVRVERIGAGRYRVSVQSPLLKGECRVARSEVLRHSAALNALFESWIRERPGEWLCMRRRWPAAPPEAVDAACA